MIETERENNNIIKELINVNNMQFINKNNPKKISNNINPNEICITIWEIMKRIVDFFNVDVIIRVDFNRDENEIDFNTYKLYKVKEFNFSSMNVLNSNVKKTYWFYGEFNVKGFPRFNNNSNDNSNSNINNNFDKLRINNNNNNENNNNEKKNENTINNINNKNSSIKNNLPANNINSFKPIFYFKDYEKLYLPPIGLINPSVYCYMNTAFQCLLSIPELSYHFSSSNYSSPKKNHPICDSFKDLIISYSSSKSKNSIYLPKSIYQTCSSLLSLNYQQDSQEFLRRFLGGIQDELNNSKKYVFPENISMNSAWNIYRSNNNSFIDSIFSGLIRSQIKCFKCKNISNTFDPFLDLSLSVNNNKNKEKLNECLNEYFKEEFIKDKDAFCDKCKNKNVKMSKKLEIVIFPPILTIHIKRFEGNGEKINTKISFKLELNLDKFVNENNNNNNLKYELFATVVHQGSSIRGGHYFAVVKRKDEWFICDDDSVSKCNEKNALNSDCYLLFYRQIQN